MFKRFAPPPHLSALVEAFWQLQTDGNRTYSGLPKPWVEMIFSLSGRHEWWAAPGQQRYQYDHSWVTPLQSGIRFAYSHGDLNLMGVRLDIFAAHRLFGDRINEPPYRPIIGPQLGPEMDDMRRRLINATEYDRIDLLTAWLSDKLNGLPHRTPPIAELEAGGWRVAALADAMGVGPRTLHKIFVKATGRSPKFWLRLARFDRALQIAANQPIGINLADLAAKTGYSDQAHMNRDFVEFGGFSPGSYVGSRNGQPLAPPHLVAAVA